MVRTLFSLSVVVLLAGGVALAGEGKPEGTKPAPPPLTAETVKKMVDSSERQVATIEKDTQSTDAALKAAAEAALPVARRLAEARKAQLAALEKNDTAAAEAAAKEYTKINSENMPILEKYRLLKANADITARAAKSDKPEAKELAAKVVKAGESVLAALDNLAKAMAEKNEQAVRDARAELKKTQAERLAAEAEFRQATAPPKKADPQEKPKAAN